MRKSIAVLILIYLSFILLLSLSGVGGFAGGVLYFLAFILPIVAGVIFAVKSGAARGVLIRKERLLPSLAFFAPSLILIIGISALTSYLLSLLGMGNITDVSGDIWLVLLRRALLPALLEEMLFRFLPARLLAARSPRAVMLVSPLLFALIHLNLFQIPYALFAGGVLAFLTLATGSILPAVLLHFVNNALSVIWMRNPDFTLTIIIAVSVLATLSLVYILVRRREYASWVREVFSGERVGFFPELAAVAVILLAAAILNLR